MSETQSDDLAAAVAQLRERVDTLESQQQRTRSLIEQFQEGAISRRTFLAAVGGAAGVTALASNARAAPSWGSATGQIGTSSEPLNQAYVKDVRAKTLDTEQISSTSVSTDDLSVTNNADLDTEEPNDVSGSRSAGTWYQNSSGTALLVTLIVNEPDSSDSIGFNFHINSSQNNSEVHRVETVADSAGEKVTITAIVPIGYYYKTDFFGSANQEIHRWSEQEIGTGAT